MTTWSRVDSGSSPGSLIADVAVVDALHVVAITANNKVLRSTDGGNTFAEVVGALPVGSFTYDMAAGNGAVVIQGQTGPDHKIYTSTDGGATWNDVTPPGNIAQGSPISFLPGLGKFITCEGAASDVMWSSSDGVTWAGTPVVGLPSASLQMFTRQYAVEGAGGVAMLVGWSNPWLVLLSSVDGITWNCWGNYGPYASVEGGTVAWNGVVFNACWFADGTVFFNEASIDGLSPAYGNGGDFVPPPYADAQAVLNGDFYTSSFLTADIGVSTDDAVSWNSDTVPDVTFVNLFALAAELLAFGEAIVSTDGAAWTTELGPFVSGGLINQVASGFGLTLAAGYGDDGNGGLWKRITVIPQVVVPPVTGATQSNATLQILAASLIVGVVSTEPSLDVPAGSVIRQNPAGGTLVDAGSAVDLVISTGFIVVPDVTHETAAQANAELLAIGLGVGPATTGFSDTIRYGSIVSQVPIEGAHVLPGTPVSYAISVPRSNFNVDLTVISQYQNSPTLLRLVHNMAEYLNKGVDLATFYQFVWNVDTAVGFGLDIWGNIVGVSRLLQIPGSDPIVGFDNADVPKDWYPMSEGRFAIEGEVTTAYTLPDDAYRVLILTKALANIITTTGPALNQLLRNMFPGRGRAFVRDLGGMAMQFVFNFSLTPVEYAILTQSGVLPHPAGVFYSVVVIPGGLFGFQGYTGALPFNYGVFNSRP